MKDMQREILNQVASGQITASDAAARLDALAAESPSAEPAASPAAPAAVLPPVSGARSVKVISVLGSANVIADQSVAVAVAEGPHRVRQDGDTMVIEHSSLDDGNDTFTFSGGRRVVVNGPDLQRRTMSIRMNPDLPLFVSVQAGNLNAIGLRGPITAEVQAGNCRLDDFGGALNLTVQAGNITATGRLVAGDSKVRCEMGSVKMNLQKGSSVRMTARSTLGKVAVEGAGIEKGSGDATRSVTIGSGTATLDIDCTMGSVRVNAE